MIVSLCSEKGSPGVTALATAMSLVWPGDRVLVEADPAGGDLSFRLRDEGEAGLHERPSLVTLATATRTGLTDVRQHSQPTTLGFPVIPGPVVADKFSVMNELWPSLTSSLSGWGGTVIADLGRMRAGSPNIRLAQASAVVLLVSRADTAALYHLRERVPALAAAVAEENRNPLQVVLTGPAKDRKQILAEAGELLRSIGSPVPIAGFIPEDPRAANDLWVGQLTRRLAGSDLVRGARALVEQLLTTNVALAGTAVAGSAFAPSAAAAAALNGRNTRHG